MRDTVNLEFVNIIKEVSEAIEKLNSEIATANEKISLIASIDISKPVTEEQWHEICETPLRYSDLLAVLVKNTFPIAENITVGCNYVFFDMMGFAVQIPTMRCYGINVDTSWYKKDMGEPKIEYSESVQKMIDCFTKSKNKLSKKKKRIMDEKNSLEQAHAERVRKYHEKREYIKSKTDILLNKLLPELEKFSKKHFNYNAQYGYSIEDIQAFEKNEMENDK